MSGGSSQDGKDKERMMEVEDGDTGMGSGGVGSGGGGDASSGLSVNQERGLVLHGGAEDLQSEDEVEFDLEEEDEDGYAQPTWLAVARYYSGRPVRARIMFAELSNAWGEVVSRDLGDNRFLLEFPSENALNFVLRGGPWKFKGDALIVVRYDGLTRLSEVCIESIRLWIRIYDMPVALMKPRLVSAFAARVGKVLEVGEAVKDFIRVRVEFDLADALKESVKLNVKGLGPMEFAVKYEDVPHFCFWCGRIGHSIRECPEEDLEADGTRYGVELRTSPFKRTMSRQLAFQRSAPVAKRGLNFSGAQKAKVTSYTTSPISREEVRARMSPGWGRSGGGEGGGAARMQEK